MKTPAEMIPAGVVKRLAAGAYCIRLFIFLSS